MLNCEAANPEAVQGMRDSAAASGLAVKLPGDLSLCLFLIFYFSVCDTALKFFPVSLAVPLRYLPETLLYLRALTSLWKGKRIWRLPLFRPLAVCVALMAVSTMRNGSAPTEMAENAYTTFRLIAFAVLAWRSEPTASQIVRFVQIFLRLTVIEILIGCCELFGGGAAKTFFAPNLDWSGSAQVLPLELHENDPSYLLGTLSNYNHFGTFMCMGMFLAMGLYGLSGNKRHRLLAWAAGIMVLFSLSRHALLTMVLGFLVFMMLHGKRRVVLSYAWKIALLLAVGAMAVASNRTMRDSLETRMQSMESAQVIDGDPRENVRLFMLVYLTPRFLVTDPVLGQGPLESPQGKSLDPSSGPQIKAAPQLPGWVTHYINDVVWLAFFGAYGLAGLVAYGAVLWVVGLASNRLRKARICPEYTVLGQMMLVFLAIFVVSGFFSQEIIARDTIPIFWCLAGMALSIAGREGLIGKKWNKETKAT